MTHSPHLPPGFGRGANGDYFERRPEKLVLEGYRRWSAGFQSGSIVPWEMAWNLYATELGPADGRWVLGELANYVRTLRSCATCPLRAFPFHSRHLCVEECLTMGLIAGLQNDADAAELCLSRIACPRRCEPVEKAAQSLASTLVETGQRMLPIPRDVIAEVLSRADTTPPTGSAVPPGTAVH